MKIKNLLFNYCVLFIAASTFGTHAHAQIISTIAGTGGGAFSGDGGLATAAMIYFPGSMVSDFMDNLFFNDLLNQRVRKIDNAGIIVTVAGNGGPFSTGDGGPATIASIGASAGLANDVAGNVFIAETFKIRKVNTAGIISTVAGNGIAGDTGDGGPATDASMDQLNSVALDRHGNMYIAYKHRVRKVDTAGIITAFAGSALSGFSGDGGPATAALFFSIGAIAIDTACNVYLTDIVNYRIRKVNPAGIVTTIAGNGIYAFSGDGGPATDASFSHALSGLAVDSAGNVYIADARNYRIRKVNPAGIITTVAGNGIEAYAGDGGPAIAASFRTPDFLAFNSEGNMYVSDRNDNRIRLITMPQIAIQSSLSTMVCAGTTDTFSATVANDAMAPIYQWQLNGATVGANSPLYITDTLHNGDVVRCMLRYVFGDTVSKSSNLITITVDSFPPHAGTLSGANNVCMGDSIALAHTGAGGLWSSTGSNAAVAAGMVHGLHPGTDTIRYIVTNGCGTDTHVHLIRVNDCLVRVASSVKQQVALHVWPNPNDGSFTINIAQPANEQVRIVIADITGTTIKELTTITNKQTTLKLNTPPGIYFITATTAHDTWSDKIVVK
jgi:hypothetical protein